LWYNSWTSGSIGFETTFWTTKGKRKRWSTVNIVATDRKLCATNLATVLVAVRNVVAVWQEQPEDTLATPEF
jgi:uncharacterized protein (DUF924 family)